MSTQFSETGRMLEAQLWDQIEQRAAGMLEEQRREAILNVLAEMTPPGWRYQLRHGPGGGIDFSLLPSFLDR
jgi:hypothetical protein